MQTFTLYAPPFTWNKAYGPASTCAETHNYWAVALDDLGNIVEPDPPALNERTRGRHDPGSGPYTNRWVFANRSDAVGQGGEIYPLFLGGEDHYGYSQLKDITGVFHYDGVYHYKVDLVKSERNQYFRVLVDYVVWKPDKLPVKEGQWKPVFAKRLSASKDFSYRYSSDPPEEEALELARAQYDEWLAMAKVPYEFNTAPSVSTCYLMKRAWVKAPGSTPTFSARPTYWADEIDLDTGNGKRLNRLVAEAYINACNNIPDLSGMSNAVNVVQLVTAGLGAIRTVMSKDFSVLPRSIGSAWLAYRYSYGTTKSDLEEASSYLGRAADLLFTDRVRCNGAATLHLADDDIVTARCSLELEKSALSNLKSTIERYGLQLDGYAAWDLVPYSFIVDWFLDVGGALEFGRRQNFARRISSNCWCSIERHWTNEYGCEEIYYHRWKGQPNVSSLVYVSHDASGATIAKRAVDVLAFMR